MYFAFGLNDPYNMKQHRFKGHIHAVMTKTAHKDLLAVLAYALFFKESSFSGEWSFQVSQT